MRTTLTLDPDVAALLEQIQTEGRKTFKETVNAALRIGLLKMTVPPEPHQPFRTKTLPVGPRSIADIANIAEVLALAEGENYK